MLTPLFLAGLDASLRTGWIFMDLWNSCNFDTVATSTSAILSSCFMSFVVDKSADLQCIFEDAYASVTLLLADLARK